MGETAYSVLPVILVSAKDNAAASYIISEIVDNDVTETYKAKEGELVQDRVWRIVNKYYTADVRLRTSGDDQLPAGDEPVDAHVIYLQQDECAASWCARRLVAGGHVRVLLAASSQPALAAWAAAHRYELVALEPEPGLAPGEQDGDDWGVRRARAALHAHAWRGLATHAGRELATLCTDDGDLDSDSESADEAAVERAELFAGALWSLPGAAAAARRAAPLAPRELRLARAEALLLEFCRALGRDLDDC